MKKLVIFSILAVTLIPLVWGAVTAPTSFVASAPTPTNITFTWSGQTELDSLALIYFDGSDSSFICYFDSTQTDSTITGLTPDTEYIFLMYARASGKKAVSVKDTMNTKVPYKLRISSSVKEGSVWLYKNTSWPPNNEVYKVFTLNAASETQTSCYFKPQPFTTIGIYLLNTVEDSSKFATVVWGGWDDTTSTAVGGALQGMKVVGAVPIDTLTVTSHTQASVPAELIGDDNGLPIYDWIWLVSTGGTACGYNQACMYKFGYSKD